MDILDMLQKTKAMASGHFVYKAGHDHGAGYIDKDKFPTIGAQNLVALLEAEAEKALRMGFELSKYKEAVLLLPAYGAIKYGLVQAAYLERRTGIKVIVAETEVERDEKGKRVHVLPENTVKMIRGLPVFGKEDIVNAGTTLREINRLLKKVLEIELFAALSTVDRGGQTTRSLGIPYYYPYLRINMEKHDLRERICPQCAASVPINTDLGKGGRWVEMFGQPPYPEGMDFSAFWRDAT